MAEENFEELKKFAQFVKNKVDEEVAKGEIKKLEINQEYFRWKIENFDYSVEKGVSSTGAKGEYFTRKRILFNHRIEEKIKQSDEYKQLLDKFKETFKIEGLDFKLESFLRTITHEYLQNNEIKEKTIVSFLKELNEEPIKIGAIVKLQGLTLEPENITISKTTILRKVRLEDLEEEKPVPYFVGIEPFINNPDAILEVEIFSHTVRNIQEYIERAIIVFRLFKVGGINSLSYKILSEAIANPIGGTIYSGERGNSAKIKYPLYTVDTSRLSNFWKEIESLNLEFLSRFATTPSGNENLHFAYQRYCDALFSNSIFEQQVTNVITGLESLYLNDFQELSKYLTLRVSKFLSLAGLDPYKVKDILKYAYRLRSSFVHGNQITYKQRKKIDNEFDSKENMLREILNLLRISIVMMLALKKQKDELIDMIDDSFIDRKKEDALREQLESIVERFCEK